MSIQENGNPKDTSYAIRSYTVVISMEEMENGRKYFRLPNGKLYYITRDTDEVYLAENQE